MSNSMGKTYARANLLSIESQARIRSIDKPLRFLCQERLTSLGMLAVEGRLARTIDYNSKIEMFASRKSRKVLL